MQLANGIHGAGWDNGGFAGPDDDPTCPELNDVAGEFAQLVAVLALCRDKVQAKIRLDAQIREAAEAFLAGRPWPVWPDDDPPIG